MKPLDIVRFEQRLDNLFSRVSDLGDDIEMQANWAKYLCVLVSGYLEISARSIFSEYAKDKSDPRVTNYVSRNLKRFINPKMEAIVKVAASFDKNWGEDLRTYSEGEVKDSVDSIVSNRHLIAHGVDVGISYISIKNYYKNAKKLVNFMTGQVIPS